MIDPAHRTRLAQLAASERRYGANTLDAYKRDLNDFTAYLANEDNPDSTIISRHIFRGWLASMARWQLARTTMARPVSSLRSFLRFCGRTQLLDIPELGWLRAPQTAKSGSKIIGR